MLAFVKKNVEFVKIILKQLAQSALSNAHGI